MRRTARDGSGLGTTNGAAEPDLIEEDGVVVVVPSSRGGDSALRGGDNNTASPLTQQEAFPSLPTAPSRPPLHAAQERHEFSLVGRLSRRGNDRAGIGGGGSSERARAGASSKEKVNRF